MKIVAVTGCMGLIGSHVTSELLQRGYLVLGIDKLTYAANMEAMQTFQNFPGFTFLQKDICELESIPDCDYVINLAAESHVGNSIIDGTDFINTNISGVQNLLKIIQNKPSNVCERPVLLHFSTDEVYGDLEEGSFTEESSLNPSNPYSATKAAADHLIKSWNRTYGTEYVIVRPTNNYGIFQYPEKLIPLSVKLLQRGKRIRLHNKGEPSRNWLHAADTANAIVTIMESGVKNEIFNISGGFEQKNIDTVKKIIDCYFEGEIEDYEQYLDFSYEREGQDVRYSVDDSKLRNLGWEPKIKFNEAIEHIVKHYKKTFVW
tara:strand:- start:919 stop:1872 length:954 start_codon:yes stop_codon:yes gene_type:complete